MPALTYNQINNACLALLVPRPKYTPEIFDCFTNLYNTGCRPTELYHLQQWEWIGGTTYKLNPSKNNNPRYLQESQLTLNFANAIKAQATQFYGAKYWKLLYFFELWFQYQPCFVGSRSIDTYIFRHRFVKELFNSGMSINDITAYMGWVNPLMAENYIFSVIETP